MAEIFAYTLNLPRLILNAADFTTLLVFLCAFLIVYLSLTKRKTNIPGPLAFPIFGNLISIVMMRRSRKNRGLFFSQLAKEYGEIFRLYFGSQLIVVLSSYDMIQKAFVKFGHHTSERPNWIPTVKEFTKIGKGIIWQNGEEWKSIRRFALQTMRDFGVGKVTLEERVLEEVDALSAIFENQKRQPVVVKRMLTVAISNIIHNIVFGFRYQHSDEQFLKLLDCFDKLFGAPPRFLSPGNFVPILKVFESKEQMNFEQYRSIILSYTGEQIEEHKSSYDVNNIRDFVDLYIKAENEDFADKDVFNKGNIFRAILDLFAAGTETTASTLNWSLLYMIGYPAVQKKCQAEIEKVVGSGRMVRLSDRNSLKYVEATLLELQRISNIATGSLPHQTSEDVNLGEYLIPKGTIVMASITSCHLDPNQWEDPTSFKPERFLDGNGNIVKRDGLIPFSIGPRICLGESLAKMEMFLIFANLLQRFSFSKVTEDQILDFTGITGITNIPAAYSLVADPR